MLVRIGGVELMELACKRSTRDKEELIVTGSWTLTLHSYCAG